MPRPIANTSPSWAMIRTKRLFAANSSRRSLLWTMYAIAAVTASPTNIQMNACVRNACCVRASTWIGGAPTCCSAGSVPGTADGDEVYGLVDRGSLTMRRSSCTRRSSGSPHQTRIARVPALGQQRDLDVVFDDRLHLLLDLVDHRPSVGAEGRRQDHLDLGRIRPKDDLLDQGQLDDVHPDLRVDDGAKRVED